jgi:hypothetical protein
MDKVQPYISYLEDAESKREEFVDTKLADMPRRINKEDCIEFIFKNGFHRSHCLRQAISGGYLSPLYKPSKKELKGVMGKSPSSLKKQRSAKVNDKSPKPAAFEHDVATPELTHPPEQDRSDFNRT